MGQQIGAAPSFIVGGVISGALEHAFTDTTLPRLPGNVEVLLRELNVPPRLGAHLRAVHDVARQLLDWLESQHQELVIDHEAVVFGAATHDIGKAIHPDELSGPGDAHERDGYRLLLDQGVEERLARFARTHADWALSEVQIEDLLVSLADKVWKGKRVHDLEHWVVAKLAAAGQLQPWEAFMELDDLLTHIAAGADERLEFQAR